MTMLCLGLGRAVITKHGSVKGIVTLSSHGDSLIREARALFGHIHYAGTKCGNSTVMRSCHVTMLRPPPCHSSSSS